MWSAASQPRMKYSAVLDGTGSRSHFVSVAAPRSPRRHTPSVNLPAPPHTLGEATHPHRPAGPVRPARRDVPAAATAVTACVKKHRGGTQLQPGHGAYRSVSRTAIGSSRAPAAAQRATARNRGAPAFTYDEWAVVLATVTLAVQAQSSPHRAALAGHLQTAMVPPAARWVLHRRLRAAAQRTIGHRWATIALSCVSPPCQREALLCTRGFRGHVTTQRPMRPPSWFLVPPHRWQSHTARASVRPMSRGKSFFLLQMVLGSTMRTTCRSQHVSTVPANTVLQPITTERHNHALATTPLRGLTDHRQQTRLSATCNHAPLLTHGLIWSWRQLQRKRSSHAGTHGGF